MRLPVAAVEEAARSALASELGADRYRTTGTALREAVAGQVRRAVEGMTDAPWLREMVEAAVREAAAKVAPSEAGKAVARMVRGRARQMDLGCRPSPQGSNNP